MKPGEIMDYYHIRFEYDARMAGAKIKKRLMG